MPFITRPTIPAREIRTGYRASRPADRLLYTDALDENAKVPAMPLVQSIDYPSKGKHKGSMLVKVGGKADPIVLSPDTLVIVERKVADEDERAAYLAQSALYHKVDEVVRLRQKMDDAVASLIGRAEEVRDSAFPRQPFGGAVLGREAGDLESYVGQYATLVRCYAEVLDGAGITMEKVQEWAKDRRYTASNHNHLRPEEPVNGDCGRDGLPVPTESGSTYTCAPLDREPATV